MDIIPWWGASEDIDDAGYEVAIYGKTVKGKQGSATMDHAGVKGKQEAWRRWTESGGEGRVKALSWWTVRGHLKLE